VGVALIGALVFQFRARKYVPGLYWLCVVLISIAGTLMTDNLVDGHGVSLNVTTAGVCDRADAHVPGLVPAASTRFRSYTIVTRQREAWYWLTILFTFALGTSAGDLISEKLQLGYWKSGLMFAALIAAVAFARMVLKAGEVLTFWAAYVLTRPLGASIGDYLLQKPKDGGLGLGTGVTTFTFLAVIICLVAYLTVTRVDLGIVDDG